MLSKVIRESYTAVPRLDVFSSYAEEPQDFPVKFESYFQDEQKNNKIILHGPVKCRDFLGDITCSYHFRNKSSIYGFEANVPEWTDGMFIQGYGLKVTFPSDTAAQNCVKNLNIIMTLFGLDQLNVHVEQFLASPKNEVHLNFALLPPILLSLFTWLVKLSAQDLSDKKLQDYLNEGNVIQFSSRFEEIHPNKDASYFSRVNPEVFLWGNLYLNICMSSKAFAYLEEYKDNIGFLHNNSGFFSQFSKQSQAQDSKKFRRLVGTIISKMGKQAPFSFNPLSKEEFQNLTEGCFLQFYDFSGRSWTLVDSKILTTTEYRSTLNKEDVISYKKFKTSPTISSTEIFNALAATNPHNMIEELENTDEV